MYACVRLCVCYGRAGRQGGTGAPGKPFITGRSMLHQAAGHTVAHDVIDKYKEDITVVKICVCNNNANHTRQKTQADSHANMGPCRPRISFGALPPAGESQQAVHLLLKSSLTPMESQPTRSCTETPGILPATQAIHVCYHSSLSPSHPGSLRLSSFKREIASKSQQVGLHSSRLACALLTCDCASAAFDMHRAIGNSTSNSHIIR